MASVALGHLWRVSLLMVSQSRHRTESHLPAVAQRVVLFHLQDYAVLGFLEYDPLYAARNTLRKATRVPIIERLTGTHLCSFVSH
jgi:hypothetical protein